MIGGGVDESERGNSGRSDEKRKKHAIDMESVGSLSTLSISLPGCYQRRERASGMLNTSPEEKEEGG